MNNSRRNFLRHSTLVGLGISLHPLSSFSFAGENINDQVVFNKTNLTEGQQLITLLQTTDVHCQLHAHDELFWENNKMVFRNAAAMHM